MGNQKKGKKPKMPGGWGWAQKEEDEVNAKKIKKGFFFKLNSPQNQKTPQKGFILLTWGFSFLCFFIFGKNVVILKFLRGKKKKCVAFSFFK